MIFLRQWHELLTWSDSCGDTQWICAFVWLEIWGISTLKEVSKRITVIRKLESDWAVARGKKSYLWIQLSAGYLCPGVSKRAQNGQPTPPPPDWNGWDISSALTAPLSLEWKESDPKIPWKMMKRKLLGYSFSLLFPAFCSLFLWLFFPFLKISVLAGNTKRFQTGRDVSDVQVNQKIRVASPLVAGTCSLENLGGDHSFLSKFPTLLFSHQKIRCPLQRISCWLHFNLHHFGGQ